MYNSYVAEIKKQLLLQPHEWDFKSNRDYTQILEHVSNSQGHQYLEIIKKKFPTFYQTNLDLLKKICSLNDGYGKTIKGFFEGFIMCSPTNLRYILHSILILEYMKKKKLNSVDIIEIGGGYGGLCFFIHNIAPLYNITINSYTIFDLLEASKLQEKYLNALNLHNVNFCQLNNLKNLQNNSFLISNYAFSEISRELQKEYINNVIDPYVTFGFLAWNFIPVYEFVKNSIIEAEFEYPRTGGHNYYVTFYPKPTIS